MQIGNGAWVAGWTSFTILLAFVASLVGPGPADRPSDPVTMVRIPPGPFVMGSEVDSPDERPAHTVELRAFEVDQLPVVNAQFAAFLNETGASDRAYGMLYDLTDPAAKTLWLGGRYAAVQEFKRFMEYSRVGSYPAGSTPDGILDMAGNVWQWTSSLYRAYPYRADDGREDPNASGDRVSRGGAQSSSAEMLRSTYRNAVPPPRVATANTPITFRCARDGAVD